MKVAVIGGGNGAFAVAADLALAKHDIIMYNRTPDKLQSVKKSGGIKMKIENSDDSVFASPIEIAESPSEAVLDADVVVVSVPTTAHRYVAEIIGDHIRDGQTVLLNPGHTGGCLEFRRELDSKKIRTKFDLCETMTLTYIARLGDGVVQIFRKSKNILYASLPAKRNSKVESLFPNLVLAKNVIETGLSNVNAVCHPPGMILNAGWIEYTKGGFFFYKDGFSKSVSRVTDSLDEERLEIMRNFEINPIRFVDLFYSIGSTADNSGGIYEAMLASEPNKTIMAPGSLDSRYVHEDIGNGLVPMIEFARVAGIETPIMSSLVTIACAFNQVDYWKSGRNNERLGIHGMSLRNVIDYVT